MRRRVQVAKSLEPVPPYADRFVPAIPIPTALNVPLSYPAAGLGPRLLAWLLDSVIAFGYVMLVTRALDAVSLWSVFGRGTAVFLVVVYLPVVLYHLVCEIVLSGQSIGKKALGLRVVRVDGTAPGLGDYLLRWLLRIVEILFLSGIPAIVSIAVTKRGQRLGDLAAGTTVVQTRQQTHLTDTIYSRLGEQHVPTYPDVEFLTDTDVQTVRDVLKRLRTEGRTPHAEQLARRAKTAIERKLGLAPVQEPPAVFLQRIVKDYNAVLDTYTLPVGRAA
ncbi:MAG: RDD family protein [Bacteroidota bacterium]